MGNTGKRWKFSYQDYLAIERKTDTRHQFVDGEVFAMEGSTPLHAAVKVNLLCSPRPEDGGWRTGRPFASDLKIRVLETGMASYADLTVVCGPLERDPEDPNAVTNPSLLAEVLSPSTEAWDRGGKFAHYQRIPSLRHYLLIDTTTARVEHYERQPDGAWRYAALGAGDTLRVLDGVELSVDALYRDLPDEAG